MEENKMVTKVESDKIDELKKMVKESIGKNKVSNWLKFLPVVILATSIIIGWTNLKNNMLEVQKDLSKLETKVQQQEEEQQDIKLKVVVESSTLKHIQERVIAIDKKLDKVLGQ